ncbi:MAG: hypothetical protein VX265_16610 [Myxococcota bacterium]|nr:hypothetical protein [Myxococcota bacterium]MEC8424999.1 hypothetical protein [Myxococcota bacterium]
MGLRDQLKRRVKSVVNKLSGEHSAAAPDELEGYSRPGTRNDDVEVVMARLRRPGAAAEQGTTDGS